MNKELFSIISKYFPYTSEQIEIVFSKVESFDKLFLCLELSMRTNLEIFSLAAEIRNISKEK